jgi:hypothetical protein
MENVNKNLRMKHIKKVPAYTLRGLSLEIKGGSKFSNGT